MLPPHQAEDLLAEIAEPYAIVLLLARLAAERDEVAMTATQRHVLTTRAPASRGGGISSDVRISETNQRMREAASWSTAGAAEDPR